MAASPISPALSPTQLAAIEQVRALRAARPVQSVPAARPAAPGASQPATAASAAARPQPIRGRGSIINITV